MQISYATKNSPVVSYNVSFPAFETLGGSAIT